MATNESTQILDDLLSTLEAKLSQPRQDSRAAPESGQVRYGDAIQAVLAGQPRQTTVVSLRDAPVVEAFRQALTDGLIRVDTANRLLQLVNEIIVRLVP